MDFIVEKMLAERMPLTQQGYLRLAYWDDRTINDLGPEEIAELPADFEEWPRTEQDIH